MNFDFVYKICTKSEWNEAKQNNIFKGTALDLKDGYIHFSDKDQVKQTLNKFYVNQTNLICLLYTSPSPRDRQKSRMPSSA